MRSQGTLVDDKEIRKVVKFLKEVAAPSFESQLLQIRTGSAVASGLGGDEEHAEGENEHDGLLNAQADPLFNKAVEIVLETRKGSVSMLQRRLAIGYTRSSRLIDAMGQAGIVGDHKGTVERAVLITPEEWEAMKAQAEADAAAAGNAPEPASDQLFDSGGQPEVKPVVKPSPTTGAGTPAASTGDAPFDAN
jgi:S-DNA-T family DNA segregation ATPase FtsK/SpoIIIE